MANKRQRRRRRERRRARIRHPERTRYLVHCMKPDGSKADHWLYIYSVNKQLSAIEFRDHPNIGMKAMAAEGRLMKEPCGCFYAAIRFSEDSLGIWPSSRQVRKRDKELFSTNLYYLIEKVDTEKQRRRTLRAELDGCTIEPLSRTLIYRRELLKARFGYRVDELCSRVQAQVPTYTNDKGTAVNPGDSGRPFNSHQISIYLRPEGTADANSCWDY